jgi:hypothetical protein
VLGKEPLPYLQQTYSYVQQEESRRSAMIHTTPVEKTGLVANTPIEHAKASNHTSSDKDHSLCDFCDKPRYTRETCWKLHGRPNRGRGGKKNSSRPQANMSESMETSREATNC